MLFSQLGLSAELLRAISDQGYEKATPVQQQTIPQILEGRDVLAGAQTGTGKTAGFVLPILHKLQTSGAKGKQRRISTLILVPTRELAAQVSDSVRKYGRHLPFQCTAIYGGVNYGGQIKNLRRGTDIVVATPGRLLDHLQQRTIDLRSVRTLVLDEADRMLDMGFMPDIKKILTAIPRERQSLLFSATFSKEIRKLANEFLQSPLEIQVARQNTAAESVNQVAYPVDQNRKRELLSYLIHENNWHQVLVFTRTKHGADRLSKQLDKAGLEATAIHGNKSQGARNRALNDFKRGKVRVLVATDVASRGLDIRQLPYVVNFELPNVPEDYIHRIGRTGRAGEAGDAVSLVSAQERKLLAMIERLLNKKIDKVEAPGFGSVKSIEFELVKKPGKPRAVRGNRSGNNKGKKPAWARRRDKASAKGSENPRRFRRAA